MKINGETQGITVETVHDEDEDETNEDASSGWDPSKVTSKKKTVVTEAELKETFLKSATEDAFGKDATLPTIDPDTMETILGRTFITTPDEEGEQKRATVEAMEFTQDRTADEAEPLMRFKCKVGSQRFDETMTHNQMLQWCDQDKDNGDFFRLMGIRP